LLTLFVPPVAAAGQLTPQQERRLAPRGDLSPGDLQRLFDAYALVQAQDMLELSESQYGQFVTRLKALQETRRRTQQERQRRLQELLRLSNQQTPPVDDAVITERLRSLRDLDDRAAGEMRRAYDAIDQVLDVRQRGRFRAFEDQMERRKFELLLRARQRTENPVRRPLR
jgi:hypothetical protein